MMGKDDDFNLHIDRQFPGAKRYAFAFISIFVVLIIIYGNSFHAGWHFDDFPNIVDNQNIHLETLSWNSIKKSFYGFHYNQKNISRPLSYLTFAFSYYVGGTDVFGYHIFNFGVHYLASIFLFLLIYNTLQLAELRRQYQQTAYSIALLSVFFWATHPIQVTAVTYIVQRMASMAALFYIMTMYFYLKGRTADGTVKKTIFFALGSVTAFLSFASKENAVMLPVSLFAYDLFLIQGLSGETVRKNVKIAAILLLGLVAIGLACVDQFSILDGYKVRPFTLMERVLTQPRVILFYISLLFYPVSSRLTLLHDIEVSTALFSPWTTFPAVIIILMIILFAFLGCRKRPLIAYCLFFFFLNHLVEGSIIPLEMIYEHRNYLPSMFVFVPLAILAISVFDYFSYNKSLQFIMSFGVVFILAAQGHTAYLRNSIFSDDLTLWQDNVKKAPMLHRPRHNLAKALMAAGLYKESLDEMQKALIAREDSRIDQKYLTYHNMGACYIYLNEYDTALPLLFKSLDLQPDNYKAFTAIAMIFLHKNSINMAEKYIDIALRLNPYYSESYYIKGLIGLKKGDIDSAINAGEKALQLRPNDYQPYFLLGEANRIEERYLPAVFCFKKYLEQYPEHVAANLALIELFYLVNNPVALRKSVLNLMILAEGKKLSELILNDHETNNILDDSRIERIVHAVQHTINMQCDGLDRLGKKTLPSDQTASKKRKPGH